MRDPQGVTASGRKWRQKTVRGESVIRGQGGQPSTKNHEQGTGGQGCGGLKKPLGLLPPVDVAVQDSLDIDSMIGGPVKNQPPVKRR